LNKESADACEIGLHNTLPFEDGKRPVQVRPAGKKEGENDYTATSSIYF
jgi:hypothetical protein